MPGKVLDSFALIAYFRDERGAEAVEYLLVTAGKKDTPLHMTDVNYAEVKYSIVKKDGTEAWELHGVGLDDAEGLPDTLRAGMVVAYELMLVAGGDGFYLEDMIAITQGGHEVLTAGLPYTAAEIEATMRSPHARRAGTHVPARR